MIAHLHSSLIRRPRAGVDPAGFFDLELQLDARLRGDAAHG